VSVEDVTQLIESAAQLVKALQWPLTIGIGWLLLRNRIPKMVPHISSLKVGPAEVVLRDSAVKVAETTAGIQATSETASGTGVITSGTTSDAAPNNSRQETVSEDLRDGEVSLWTLVSLSREIEQQLRDLAIQNDMAPAGDSRKRLPTGSVPLSSLLARSGVLSSELSRAVREFADFRNNAVHVRDPSQEDLELGIRSGRILRARLESLREKSSRFVP